MGGGPWLVGGVAVLASGGSGWGVAMLGLAIARLRRGRVEGVDWVEQARQVFPARKLVVGDAIVIPLVAGAVVALRVAPAAGLDPRPWGVLAASAALAGVLAAGRWLEGRIARMARPWADRPRGITLGTLLIPGSLAPFGLMLAVMPGRWGWQAGAVLVAGAALATFHVCAGWLVPLRWLGLVRPASPRLAGVVGRMADRVGVRPRATFELASPQVNALAWPVPGLLMMMGPILEVLDDDELGAIVAHELGHLDEPWTAYLARLGGSYYVVACAACLPLIGSYGVLAGLVPFGVVVALVVVVRRVGRRMEERSDRIGREHEGESAGTYARALEAIYRANLIPAVMPGKRAVHPHLFDRLESAGVAPGYPRPSPPPRAILAELPGIALVAVGAWAFLTSLYSGPIEASRLDREAGQTLTRGDAEGAVDLYRRAADLDPGPPLRQANLANALAAAGRLDEAEAALGRAEAAQREGGSDHPRAAAFFDQIRAYIRYRRAAGGP